jgi:TonB-linked SusC/RagA family outer membrane protein
MQKLLHVRIRACTIMKVSLIQILLATVFTGLAYTEGTSARGIMNGKPAGKIATAFNEQPALITVTGTIKDEQGDALPGVNIIEKNTQNGTTTDAAGKYSISVADENSILVFSFIGYGTKEIPVGSSTTLDIVMEPDVTNLGEVVVIGYGEREKKDLTGSISNMTSEDIQKSVSLTPELAMQGRMTGVFVSTPGGNPNARPTVRVRGVSTFNNAEPLYVVDGVPILEFGAGSGGDGSQTADLRGNQNVLSMINPGDIESITVLKDASASAIYGSRAANGVVLITTKRGKVGKPVVEFNARRGVQNIPKKFDVLNTADFTALYQESFENDYRYRTQQAPTPNPAAPYVWNDPARNYLNVFNPNSTDPYYKYLGNSPSHNWQNDLINKDAVIEDYSVRISGGSEATTYYVGAGYSKTESPLIQNYNERYSISTNVQTKISDIFEVGLLMRTTYMEALDNTSGSLSQVALVSPWQPVYDPSDPTGFMRSTDIAFETNPDFDLALADPGPAQIVVPGSDQLRPFGVETSSNFFAQMALDKTDYSMQKNFGTAYLQVQPLAGLKIRGGLSVDYTLNKRNDWSHTVEAVRFNESGGNPYASQDGTAIGTLRERNSRNVSIIPDLTVNYTRSLGDHHVDLLLNASQQDFKYGFNQLESPQSRIEPEFRSIGGANRWNSSLAVNQSKAIQGYVGRLSYSFKDKYYLDASVRRDGSSEFAPSQRWGTFPAISLGWRLSSEDLFTRVTSVFDDLKLRTGYGVLGNSFSQGFGYNSFAYLSTVSSTPDYALGSGNGDGVGAQRSGSTLPNFPNVGLTWEKAKTFNIGLDGALLGSQLRFTVEYYDKNTEGIIQGVPLPANSGISQDVSYNVASVRNSGIEIELGYDRKFGELTVGISGNLTTVKNRVTKLHLGVPRYDLGIVEGQSVGFIYGYRAGGIFQTQQEVDAWRANHQDQSGANPQPGDMWFKDLYGNPSDEEPYKSATPDSLVNTYDRDIIGKTVPGFYYGFNLSAQYKGFDLGIFFQGVGDVQKYNSARAAGESMGGQGLNLWSTTKDRWTPENPSTTMPRAIFNDPNGNNRYSTRFVESGAFVRLKTLQLGYTLPRTVLESLKVVNSFRVYLMGTNLFTATGWSGIDPENDFVPPTRVISLGLNASF